MKTKIKTWIKQRGWIPVVGCCLFVIATTLSYAIGWMHRDELAARPYPKVEQFLLQDFQLIDPEHIIIRSIDDKNYIIVFTGREVIYFPKEVIK